MKVIEKNFFLSAFKYIFLIFIVSMFIAMSFSFISCDSKDKVIKIGNQSVFSGDDKFYGQDQMISLQIAANELSPVRVGGFDYRINIISKDDESNAEKAFLVAQEFVDENVVAVIGSSFNGTTKAAVPVYSEYNIPAVTPSAQGVDVATGFNNFYRMPINNSQKIENIVNFLSDTINPSKLILIDNGEDYSIKLVEHMIEIFDSRQIEYAERYSVRFNQEEYTVLAETLFFDAPDTVFVCANYNELAYLVAKTRELGVNCTFITEEKGMDKGITEIVDKNYLEGLMSIIPEPPTLAKYTEDKKAIDFWRKYNDYIKDYEDEDLVVTGPGKFAPYSYDAMYILIDAIRKANSILPQDFRPRLNATSYDGLTGKIEFNSNGERVNPLSTVFIIRNGDWVRFQ